MRLARYQIGGGPTTISRWHLVNGDRPLCGRPADHQTDDIPISERPRAEAEGLCKLCTHYERSTP